MANSDLRCHAISMVAMLAVLTICFGFAESVSAVILYENNIEDDPVGIYTVANLSDDWNGVSSNDGVDEGRVSITDDEHTVGSKSLVVMYPEGESNNGKSQWKMPIGGDYDELYLSYKIRFHDNFNFVRGGKLPGLCGDACNSGGSTPTGTDGWSARMMWRTDGSGQGGGSPLDPDQANIVQYVYHPDQTGGNPAGKNGDDLKWDDTTPSEWQLFDSDVWYQLQHRIVMNTPGQYDGIVQAWLDDEMVLDRQNIRFRDISSIQIDTLYFSTFFGGSSSIWETTKDEYVYYDDFVISTEFINTSSTPGDFVGDGYVDGLDFLAWQQDPTIGNLTDWEANYGPPVSSTSFTVPESNTILLLASGMAAFSLAWWRRL